MKALGREGRMGTFLSLPRGAQAGSDVANMSIMGYDPRRELTGRGPLESAALGINLEDDEIAFRCNLITVEGDTIADYSAGYIPTPQGHKLIESLKEAFDGEQVTFHAGNSFRNILVLKGEWISDELRTTPPHDIVGQPLEPYLPKALSPEARRTEETLARLILASRDLLAQHPVNAERRGGGMNPGNMIWPWSPGARLKIVPFERKWGLRGAAISAVDTVKGLAKSAGMPAPDIPGATGFVDTDYEAKAEAAMEMLRTCDLVYVHVEGIDEMGHSGDVKGKIDAIEDYDSRLVRKLLEALDSRGWDYRIAVIPDHYTPCTIRTHVRDPTPFAIAESAGLGAGPEFDEEHAKLGTMGMLRGDEFIRALIT
jgi:2,3-bisphosphoglycerate-independent phosphoglycerate mutase